MKWKSIVSNAEKVKKSIEKDKKLPSVKGYNYAELLYLFAKAVRNPNKDIADKKVSVAPNPSGNNIEKNLTKDEYQKLAKHTIEWIDDKGTCPNYTIYGNYHIRPKLQLYCYSKIIVYFDEHSNTLPLKCWFKSSDITNTKSSSTNNNKSSGTSTSNSLKPYMTNQGCSGMGQCTEYYCACNSLQQAFYRLTGIKVEEKTIAGWAGTTTSGTSHQGIETAIAAFNLKYNKKIKITWKNFSDLGSNNAARWNKLKEYVNKGAVFCHILYRLKWGHYECVKDITDNNVIVLNSLGNSCGGSTYCGYIETRSKSEQLSYIQGISQKSIAILTKG